MYATTLDVIRKYQYLIKHIYIYTYIDIYKVCIGNINSYKQTEQVNDNHAVLFTLGVCIHGCIHIFVSIYSTQSMQSEILGCTWMVRANHCKHGMMIKFTSHRPSTLGPYIFA